VVSLPIVNPVPKIVNPVLLAQRTAAGAGALEPGGARVLEPGCEAGAAAGGGGRPCACAAGDGGGPDRGEADAGGWVGALVMI
jgi:hypothetical protein